MRSASISKSKTYSIKRLSIDVDELLGQILEVICDVLNYRYCAILLLDETTNELFVKAALGYDTKAIRNLRIRVGEQGITGRAAALKRPIYVPEVRKNPLYIKGTPGGRSELAVPLLIGDKLIGILDIESPKPNAFSRRDMKVLSLFASQAAVAIEYARLYEKERKRSAQLALINEISKEMATTLNIDQLLTKVVTAIQRSFNYYHVMILTIDRERQEIVMRAQAGGFSNVLPEGYRRRLGEGIVGIVAQTGESLLANDVTKEPHYLAVRQETRSELCVPIKDEHEVYGVINVEAKELNAFDENDVLILETISDQLVNVLKNVRIYQECKEAKDHLQKLVESSSDAITATDIHGRLTFWSKGAEEIFGYTAQEALGRPAKEFYADGIKEAIRVMRMLSRKEKIRNWETVFIGKNGKKIYASLSFSLLKDENGQPTGTLGIIRDISEFKELQRQLIQAERLAAIGRLSAQIAHEIRNPLSSIKMNIKILSKRQDLTEGVRRHLQIASAEVDRLEKILQDILDYVKPFKLELSLQDLNEVVEESLRQVEPKLKEKGVSVVRNYAQNLPKVWIDPFRLSMALNNLYSNALQSMCDGGQLTITTRRLNRANKDSVKVIISDCGSGISPEDIKYIFEPFFTTRSDGIGLGLTIVKKIVEQHNGTISVRSRQGEGTTFTLSFPAASPSEEDVVKGLKWRKRS